MKTSDFDYDLPQELIAQQPLPDRTDSRMMVVHRTTGKLEHRCVLDLPEYLHSGDLLVVNDTRVIPARIFGRREGTGGRVELLLIEETEQGWHALYRASRPARAGMCLVLCNGKLRGEILAIAGDGQVTVGLSSDRPVNDVLEEEGFAPVPPYIKREKFAGQRDVDRDRYQTVYARRSGAVAAPTAGLHFSAELLSELTERGVQRTAVTLHVGPGTFRPVKTELVQDHIMAAERYVVGDDAAGCVNAARAAGARIVAVGSTTVRTLETVIRGQADVPACSGRSSLFIYPPYDFRIVDVMLTNFHLPKSTLLMMVSAFTGISCHVLFTVEGEILVEGGGVRATAATGTSCLLPAALAEYKIQPVNCHHATVIRICPGPGATYNS